MCGTARCAIAVRRSRTAPRAGVQAGRERSPSRDKPRACEIAAPQALTHVAARLHRKTR
jgi:hypothetical protein